MVNSKLHFYSTGLSVILVLLMVSSCLPSKCHYEDEELKNFNNIDSSGISFIAHKEYDQHLFKTNALEKEIGEEIEYGTTMENGIQDIEKKFEKMSDFIPGADLDLIDKGSRDGMEFLIYQSSKGKKETLSLYLGNAEHVSSVLVTYMNIDGGCEDAAMDVINSVNVDMKGYRKPFVPTYERKTDNL